MDQQYLPDAIRDRKYYQFGDNKNEQAAAAYWQRIKGDKFKNELATPHNSRLAAKHPLRQLRHGICVAKMLDKTSSIICAFGLASAAPRSPYRHLELCGIANYNCVQ